MKSNPKIQTVLVISLVSCLVVIASTGLAQAEWKKLWLTESSNIQIAQVEPSDQAEQPSSESDTDTVAQVTLSYLLEENPESEQEPEIARAIVVEDYALVTWYWGEAGGQTVLAKTEDTWDVIGSGGGAVDVGTLEEMGIPTAIAQQIIAQEQLEQQE